MSLYRLADGLKDRGPEPNLAPPKGTPPPPPRRYILPDERTAALARIEADREAHAATVRAAGGETISDTLARIEAQADPESTARLLARFDLRSRGIDPDQFDALLLSQGIDLSTLTADRKPRTSRNTGRSRKSWRSSNKEIPPSGAAPRFLAEADKAICDCGVIRHLEKGGVRRSMPIDGRTRHCAKCGPTIAAERCEAFGRLLAESLQSGWWLVTVAELGRTNFNQWLGDRRKVGIDIPGISTPTDRHGTRAYLLRFGGSPPPNRYGTTEAIGDPQQAHDKLIKATHALARFEHSVGQTIGQTIGIGSWKQGYATALADLRTNSGWRSVGIETNSYTEDERRAKVAELDGKCWRTSAQDLCAQFPTEAAEAEWEKWLGVIPDDELAERRRVKKLAVAEWDRINDPALYTAA